MCVCVCVCVCVCACVCVRACVLTHFHVSTCVGSNLQTGPSANLSAVPVSVTEVCTVYKTHTAPLVLSSCSLPLLLVIVQ